MKHIRLSILILPLLYSSSHAMEKPNATATTEDSTVPIKYFIGFINRVIDSRGRDDEKASECGDAIYYACWMQNAPVFEAILNRWKALPDEGLTSDGKIASDLLRALVESADRGNCNFLKKILDATNNKIIDKPSICWCVEPGEDTANRKHKVTALGQATFKGNHEAVRLLLAHGANPELGIDPDSKGQSPLVIAIQRDKPECTKQLLRGTRKANPNAGLPDKSFGSILHWALSLKNRNQHVKILLESGADKNLIRKGKEYEQEGTPLMVAVAFANEQGVKMLLECGADISIKNPFNKQTALELAELKLKVQESTERLNIVDLIKQVSSKQSGATPGAV